MLKILIDHTMSICQFSMIVYYYKDPIAELTVKYSRPIKVDTISFQILKFWKKNPKCFIILGAILP